jgi:hypothetical protein
MDDPLFREDGLPIFSDERELIQSKGSAFTRFRSSPSDSDLVPETDMSSAEDVVNAAEHRSCPSLAKGRRKKNSCFFRGSDECDSNWKKRLNKRKEKKIQAKILRRKGKNERDEPHEECPRRNVSGLEGVVNGPVVERKQSLRQRKCAKPPARLSRSRKMTGESRMTKENLKLTGRKESERMRNSEDEEQDNGKLRLASERTKENFQRNGEAMFEGMAENDPMMRLEALEHDKMKE